MASFRNCHTHGELNKSSGSGSRAVRLVATLPHKKVLITILHLYTKCVCRVYLTIIYVCKNWKLWKWNNLPSTLSSCTHREGDRVPQRNWLSWMTKMRWAFILLNSKAISYKMRHANAINLWENENLSLYACVPAIVCYCVSVWYNKGDMIRESNMQRWLKPKRQRLLQYTDQLSWDSCDKISNGLYGVIKHTALHVMLYFLWVERTSESTKWEWENRKVYFLEHEMGGRRTKRRWHEDHFKRTLLFDAIVIWICPWDECHSIPVARIWTVDC